MDVSDRIIPGFPLKTEEALIGFSVVVPSFNHAKFISDALNSLLNQNYTNLEIIVVDGGSTDGTIDILKEYGENIRWVSEKDDGQSDALANGFTMATKEWLTWLNSDDIQTNNALHRVNETIRRNPEAHVVIGQAHYMDEEGNYLRPYPTIDIAPGIDISHELFSKGYVAQPSVYFNRDAYHKVGGIDRNMQFAMDYDLWVRLALNGYLFAAIQEDISGNRWYAMTKTSSQPLPLMAEAVAVQIREFGRVSAYFVQAISDYFYSVIHSPYRGDKNHFVFRMIYFKAFWIILNCRRPFHCLWGLITQNMAKSGPIVGDKLTVLEMIQFVAQAFKERFKKYIKGPSKYE